MSAPRISARRRSKTSRGARRLRRRKGHGGLPVRFPRRNERLAAVLARADAEAPAGMGHLDRRAVQARAVQGRRSAGPGRQAGEGQEEVHRRRPFRRGEGPGRRLPPGHGGEPGRRRGARPRVPDPRGGRLRRGPADPQDVSAGAPLSGVVEHLFRHEAGRLSAALVRVLGPANLDLAEDVVQETLCHSLDVWKMGRVPDNPAAWLRTAARNRALDLLRKERTKTRLSPQLEAVQDDLAPAVDAAFTEDALRREQLRMMFACCAPRLQPPVQVALVLKLLCGFGVDEVAHAFLSSPCSACTRRGCLCASIPRAPWCRSKTRTGPPGIVRSWRKVRGGCPGPRPNRLPRSCSRRPSPRSIASRTASRTPIGARSWPCTTRCTRSTPPRWSR